MASSPIGSRSELTAQLVAELMVQDVGRSVEFYQAVGFEVVRTDGGFVVLRWGDAYLFLLQVGERQPPPPQPVMNLRVIVSDADAIWRRAREAELPVVVEIGDRYYGLRDFTLRDPDGFAIRFAELLGAQ